jgi:hypothetical protein
MDHSIAKCSTNFVTSPARQASVFQHVVFPPPKTVLTLASPPLRTI